MEKGGTIPVPSKTRKFGLSIMYTLSIIFLAISLSASAPISVKLSEKDVGRTVKMGVGDVLEITLKGNPTTGYTWGVASPDNGILEQVGEPEFEPGGKSRGSGGNIILRFAATGVGEVLLQLIYHRPFEKHKLPIKTFEVNITVK